MTLTTNQQAFLDMIALSEGVRSGIHPLTRCDGYDVIVTGIDGPEIFTDFHDHPFAGGRPSKIINQSGLTSNAAGRYQIMLRWWPAYKRQLALPDFGPASQDAYALQQLRERGALPLLEAGRFDDAVNRVRSVWASLPGAGYGQHENSLDTLRLAYVDAGGKLA